MPVPNLLAPIRNIIDKQGNASAEEVRWRDWVTKRLLPALTGNASDVLTGAGTFATPATGISQLTGDVTAGPGSGSQAATIPNDTVTNAKAANMAAETIKGRAVGAGTGDPTDLDADDVSDILDGAADPFLRTSASGGSGGALVLLEQHTASASATLDFTTAITSTYDTYLIELLNVIPATDAALLWLRVSTDGGSTFDTSASYSDELFAFNGGGSAASGATGGTKSILTRTVRGNGSAPGSSWGVTGHLTLYDPLSASLYKQFVGEVHYYHSAGVRDRGVVGGAWESATAVNAIRFLFSSGNITSGTIRVYGIAKT